MTNARRRCSLIGDTHGNLGIEPEVCIDSSHGLSRACLSPLKRIVEERRDEINRTWIERFRR